MPLKRLPSPVCTGKAPIHLVIERLHVGKKKDYVSAQACGEYSLTHIWYRFRRNCQWCPCSSCATTIKWLRSSQGKCIISLKFTWRSSLELKNIKQRRARDNIQITLVLIIWVTLLFHEEEEDWLFNLRLVAHLIKCTEKRHRAIEVDWVHWSYIQVSLCMGGWGH